MLQNVTERRSRHNVWNVTECKGRNNGMLQNVLHTYLGTYIS